MAKPSDLIAHYSSLAFYTRIAALTFVGGVLGTVFGRIADTETRRLVGVGLILVVVSLGELNRRFTDSYMAACRTAENNTDSQDEDDLVAARQWHTFQDTLEPNWNSPVSRFLLRWFTYLPGLLLGGYLLLSRESLIESAFAVAIVLAVMAVWIRAALKASPPRQYLPETPAASAAEQVKGNVPLGPNESEEAAGVGRVEKYETVVSSGQSALRALLTMNGGAVIVFLTFLGTLWDRGKIPQQTMPLFVAALAWWIGGIFSTLLSYGSIFVTNCFSSINWHRSSNAAFVVTLICGFASLVCFLIGSWRAIDGFQSVPLPPPRGV